jgi:hypothetical protein
MKSRRGSTKRAKESMILKDLDINLTDYSRSGTIRCPNPIDTMQEPNMTIPIIPLLSLRKVIRLMAALSAIIAMLPPDLSDMKRVVSVFVPVMFF